MNFTNRKIGIWGLGAVGGSALRYCLQKKCSISVLDQHSPSAQIKKLLKQNTLTAFDNHDLADFLNRNDFIIPSPGIDLRPHTHYQHKWLSELDLFAHEFNAPIIAITGSVGKTTVTHLLAALLQKMSHRVAVGGNIGTPMLDLLEHQPVDLGVLEVSSFQLELAQTFAPDLAIWTNFSPNHLDRHDTLEDYCAAKMRIIGQQTARQKSLLPLSLIDTIMHQPPASQCYFFTTQRNTHLEKKLRSQDGLFVVEDNELILYKNTTRSHIFNLATLPPTTFAENWLVITSALHLLNIPLATYAHHAQKLTAPEHRLEKILTHNGVTFYNDSKSTTPASTKAAVQQLSDHPIHLFLGGLSKGIDREPLVQFLGTVTNLKHVYCFGKEAENLQKLCNLYKLKSSHFTDLDSAFAACTHNTHNGDTVLFSPSGSSFDLFANFAKRGVYFKQLVENLPT